MEGFFTAEQTKSELRPDGKVVSCASCGRSVGCKNPKFTEGGEGRKGIYILLPYPSKTEDSKGEVGGQYYRILKKLFAAHKIDIDRDCWVGYSVRCAGGIPTEEHIRNCRKNTTLAISKKKPKVVLFFGNEGLRTLIGHRWKKDLDNIDKWQGFCIPDQEMKTFLIPTYPLYRLEDRTPEPYEHLIKKAIGKAVECTEKEFPVYKEPNIVYLSDLEPLRSIKSGHSAFDYETTGKKPHGKGHRCICASIATDENTVYTFLIPPTKKEREPFIEYLKNKNCLKYAHNLKFEDTWSEVRLRTKVQGWVWDSMLAAHIVDNRPGITGLKFQTYVNFGVIDYDSEISSYLKSDDNKNGNAINKIEKCLESPELTKKLLKYCALDSIFEIRLANIQRKYMAGTTGQTPMSPLLSDYMNAYRLFHEGILALSDAEKVGLRIDTEYLIKTQSSLTRKIDRLEKKVKESTFFKEWQKCSKSPINIDSNTSLATYLYQVRGEEPKKFTDKGSPSTDEEALAMLKIPECDMLISRSKLKKLRDTFLENFLREQVNGTMHPNFHLHLVRTYRSSSSNPNFQNIPKRDKFAFNTCRSAIFPRKGNQLLEVDFSGMEVSIAACYHQDPNMLKYLHDDTKDMHGDMAAQIFCIKDFNKHAEDHSLLRKAAKNSFVFPQFYGDYYKNNADGLRAWAKLPPGKWTKTDGIVLENGEHIGAHLISKGIKSGADFIEHLRKIEDHFWKVRFGVYGKWKDRQWDFYLQNGYVPYKTGFTAQGVMNKKEAINYPIQGAAFHVMLWCLVEIGKRLEEGGYESKIVGQIHDAMVFDIVPSELHSVHALIVEVSTKTSLKKFPWINVPLRVDAELCEVDQNWTTKKEYFVE